MSARGPIGSILLTGVNGQVGGALLPLLREFGEVCAPVRAELDLADADSVREYVRALRPRWIVNPAAYTAVDKAETDVDTAMAINATAPRVLGEVAAELGIPVLHFSTDYVFDGSGTKPWVESDPTGPLGVYGRSKLKGEQGLAASGAAHAILRTSWVYGATGKNFLLTILRLAREREQMNIVADQHGAPTWSRELARLVCHIVRQTERSAFEQGVAPAEILRERQGLYHATASGETTWFGFAEEIVRLARAAEPEQRFATLHPVASTEYPTPARRPHNSRLTFEKLERTFGFSMMPWEIAAAEVMALLLPRRDESDIGTR
jgi:dTDP-4-dehydrorhamnose reductase